MRLKYFIGCGKSTIKVRRKYAGSKAEVRLKNGKSTVKYGKSTVLYGNFFLAPTVCMITQQVPSLYYKHICTKEVNFSGGESFDTASLNVTERDMAK